MADDEIGDPAPNAPNAARMRVPMPVFDGADASGIGSHAAREFIESFNDWCELAEYDDDQKARALRYALKGVAKSWWTSEQRSRAVDLTDWPAASAAFRARFVSPPNPRFIDEELGKLTQRPKESVRAYLDRVKIAVSLLQDLWPIPPGDNAVVREAKRVGNQLVYERLVLQFFLRSLRPAIKSGIAQAPGLITLQDFVQASVRAEELLAEVKPASAPVAEVSTEVAGVKVDSSKGKSKKNKKKETVSVTGSSTAPSSNPNARANPPNPNSTPPSGYVCRICHVPGHWIQYCPNKGSKRADASSAPSRPLQTVTYHPVVPQPGSYLPMASPINVFQPVHSAQGGASVVPHAYAGPSPPAPQPAVPPLQPGLELHELNAPTFPGPSPLQPFR